MTQDPPTTQSGFPRVAGNCPMGCGKTLFLGAGGHVTCSWIDCPEPSAAGMILEGNGAYVATLLRMKAVAHRG